MNINVALLHENMVDKQGKLVTTSLTLIDIHDISRSAKTYGANNFFISHPAQPLRNLADVLTAHWKEGHGSTYNPDRKDALGILHVNKTFSETTQSLEKKYGAKPILIATSAIPGKERTSFREMKKIIIENDDTPHLLMLGTGWGMSNKLLEQADYFLEPIQGPTEYNHLSVRSACAIMLDRLCSSLN